MSSTISHSSKSKRANQQENDATKKENNLLENLLDLTDLQLLQTVFMTEGDGYDNKLSLDKEKFGICLAMVLKKGTKEQYSDLFDKIDATKEGAVDWDKFAEHLLLEFYGRDDRKRSSQVPQWKETKYLPTPHRDIIQRVCFSKNMNRYVSVSREGLVALWKQDCRLQRSIKIGFDYIKPRDMWVTDFALMPNINKIALAFTSKEIAVYDMSSKLDYTCHYIIQDLPCTPISLDYWYNPDNLNESILVFGDTAGHVTSLEFNQATSFLFERPAQPAGEEKEQTLTVKLDSIVKGRERCCESSQHQGHKDWVRQVKYVHSLECFISCSTSQQDAIVLGWRGKGKMRTSAFEITDGVCAFDYHEELNLIASAGVNKNVCLWNPYVISKAVGVLRGHMASVIQVQFNRPKSQLISMSKDKVVRVWDVMQQMCLQRLAGMFPRGPEMNSFLYFHEEQMRMMLTFNYQFTMTQMKPETKNRITSHDKPVTAILYNSVFNQIVSADSGSNIYMWMLDSGQKAKKFTNCHGKAEITCMAHDFSETRLYTGSTDGTVKEWDYNGHCHHVLNAGSGQPCDITQVLFLKRQIAIVGWDRTICIFRSQFMTKFLCQPSDWKGGQKHQEDILSCAFSNPITMATGSYDGEIVIWNLNSENASKQLQHKMRPAVQGKIKQQAEARAERPQSRLSTTSNDEAAAEQGYAINCLYFLETRKTQAPSGAGNIVACGGSGWVRFYNTIHNKLVADYVAHAEVGGIIMHLDNDEIHLITGDVDGYVKVWDISDYAMESHPLTITDPPTMVSSWAAHLDSISGIQTCERSDCKLIITSSTDHTIVLWDIAGHHYGTFGQEELWKIEPWVEPPEEETPLEEGEGEEEEESSEYEEDEDDEAMLGGGRKSKSRSGTRVGDDSEEYDPEFRYHTWDRTRLGMQYAETRVTKRERRQPGLIPDMPYLTWERTGKPPAGPYASLDTQELKELGDLNTPGFITSPSRYMVSDKERTEIRSMIGLPEGGPQMPFDERSLFPRYILEMDQRMKTSHQFFIEGMGSKASSKAGSKFTAMGTRRSQRLGLNSTATSNRRGSVTSMKGN